MAVSTRTRFEIFKRDKFTCQYCGRTPPSVVLHVDHIEAVSTGGSDKAENLVTACQDCNLGKSNVPLSQVPKPLKEIAKERTEKRKQLEAYHAMLQSERDAEDAIIYELSVYWCNLTASDADKDKRILNDRSAESVRIFLKKLDKFTVMDAMKRSVYRFDDGNRNFRYFCGICWKTIKKNEEGRQ